MVRCNTSQSNVIIYYVGSTALPLLSVVLPVAVKQELSDIDECKYTKVGVRSDGLNRPALTHAFNCFSTQMQKEKNTIEYLQSCHHCVCIIVNTDSCVCFLTSVLADELALTTSKSHQSLPVALLFSGDNISSAKTQRAQINAISPSCRCDDQNYYTMA